MALVGAPAPAVGLTKDGWSKVEVVEEVDWSPLTIAAAAGPTEDKDEEWLSSTLA